MSNENTSSTNPSPVDAKQPQQPNASKATNVPETKKGKYQAPGTRNRVQQTPPEPKKPVHIPKWVHDESYRKKISMDAEKAATHWQANGEYHWADEWRAYAKAVLKAPPHKFMELRQPPNLSTNSCRFQKASAAYVPRSYQPHRKQGYTPNGKYY